jgi:hypothetical protein
VPFDHVIEFLRTTVESGQDISPVHAFVNMQFRPVAWPSSRLRFKPEQTVWVSIRPREWKRATVEPPSWASRWNRACVHTSHRIWSRPFQREARMRTRACSRTGSPLRTTWTCSFARSARPRRQRQDLLVRTCS